MRSILAAITGERGQSESGRDSIVDETALMGFVNASILPLKITVFKGWAPQGDSNTRLTE